MSETPTTHVYMFNSPQFFFGLFGHSGVVIEQPDGSLHLYSFHPKPNEGEMFDEGSVAQIAHPEDGRNLDTFIHACLQHHAEDTRKDNRGIILDNGFKTWNERIRGLLGFTVEMSRARLMEEFALAMAAHPRRFNTISYSCQHFVDETFAQGGLILYGKRRPLTKNPIPNLVFRFATGRSTHCIAFERIDCEAYDAQHAERHTASRTPAREREGAPA